MVETNGPKSISCGVVTWADDCCIKQLLHEGVYIGY